jgi:hypothetical protein
MGKLGQKCENLICDALIARMFTQWKFVAWGRLRRSGLGSVVNLNWISRKLEFEPLIW